MRAVAGDERPAAARGAAAAGALRASLRRRPERLRAGAGRASAARLLRPGAPSGGRHRNHAEADAR